MLNSQQLLFCTFGEILLGTSQRPWHSWKEKKKSFSPSDGQRKTLSNFPVRDLVMLYLYYNNYTRIIIR